MDFVRIIEEEFTQSYFNLQFPVKASQNSFIFEAMVKNNEKLIIFGNVVRERHWPKSGETPLTIVKVELQGILYCELLSRNQVINSQKYCSQLGRLKTVIQKNHCLCSERKLFFTTITHDGAHI